MAKETIILNRDQIREHIDVRDSIQYVEDAMAAYEDGKDYLPPKAIFDLPVGEKGNALAACITGMTSASNLLSMKLGQERTLNPERGLPTTVSWLTLFDPDTGELLLISDGTMPTMYRTAAAAAVSTKHLARADASILCVLGAGQLGSQCVRAITGVRTFEKVYLCDKAEEFARGVAKELSAELGIPIEYSSPEEAVRAADVVATATNSRQPIIQSDWVQPGTHFACMGTDLHEKIECDMELLKRCRLFADKVDHACQRGEVSQAIVKGVLPDNPFTGSLGQVIRGRLEGRQSDDQITLFDGVGIGIQDTAIAQALYNGAKEAGVGVRFAFS